MIAISIQQPWAWAIFHAGKNVENRNWISQIVGVVAIHVPQKIDRTGIEILRDMGFEPPATFETGVIIGQVRFDGCYPLARHRAFFGRNRWAAGPYCHVLKSARLWNRPVACKGQLGFFHADVSEPLSDSVNGVLARHGLTTSEEAET